MTESKKERNYYKSRKEEFALEAQQVGWKDDFAQQSRFTQFLRLLHDATGFTINDLGCGYGHMHAFLSLHFEKFEYFGYDTNSLMIEQCQEKFKTTTNTNFKLINNTDELNDSDFTVASGIFNLKFDKTDDIWLDNILATIHKMDKKSKEGFAFNILTKYSDKNFMKDELYYADPCFFFDYCKRNFSLNVALLHDYNQYDFTIIVRKS